MPQKITTLIVLMLVLISTVYASPFAKKEILNAASKSAVCNDGSPGAYYLRSGSGSGLKRWSIFLEGGFYCFTPGCDGRNQFLTSSLRRPSIRNDDRGLFSQSSSFNPDFYNSNMVIAVYCSSDLWAGNRFEPSGSRPIQFRGIQIFRAMISDLKNKSGTNLLSPNTEVLLTGGSAGGTGVMVHLDWLAEQLPKAKVRGLNDGGWFPENAKGTNQLISEIKQGIPLWNGKSDLDCERANRNKKIRCYQSSVFPYIKTPLFVHESQWDPFFVSDTTQPPASEFAKAVRDSLIPVPAAFSERKSNHVLIDSYGFFRAKVGDSSLRDVLRNWFFDRPGKVKVIQK
jgi:O-palmitoleoyl-L-serine hydrolase